MKLGTNNPTLIAKRFCRLICLALAIACALAAQTTDPIVAKAELERVRALVNAGALPRKALAKAEAGVEQAELFQTVRKTLLETDLTEAQLPEMLRAVERLRDIARAKLSEAISLVEAGALPRQQLQEFREDAEFAEKQYDLAHSRANIVREMAAMARAEKRLEELEEQELAFHSEGTISFWEYDLPWIDAAFFDEFGRPLPISAQGDTDLHRSLGFDHRDRIDVAVHPDDEEGIFLITLLESWGIPYIAFRSAVPGQSTAAHIHIGTRSDRIPPVAAKPAPE